MIKMVIVFDMLSKSLLSKATWKIRDLFPPVASPLVFDGSLSFSLRIDIVEFDVESEVIKLALHHEDCSSLCQVLIVLSVPFGGGTLMWSNR